MNEKFTVHARKTQNHPVCAVLPSSARQDRMTRRCEMGYTPTLDIICQVDHRTISQIFRYIKIIYVKGSEDIFDINNYYKL